jgi:hypothetical protein
MQVDALAFEESGLWAADYFAVPRHWPKMQGNNAANTLKSVPEIMTPDDDPEAFAESGGYSALHFRGLNGITSNNDVPGYAYYTTYAMIENGRRTSGQRIIEEYHGKNLDVLVDTMVDRITFESDGRASDLQTSKGVIAIKGQLLIAANVYETPSLLQRSGVGPQEALQKLGVSPASIHMPIHEEVGNGYWNNIYISRYFGSSFDFDLRFGQDLGSNDRMHTFARRKMFGIDARVRGDHDLPGGWLDIECSSDMPRGVVRASGTNMRPDGQWPHEVDFDAFIKVCADCAQAYFLDTWWPMYKAFRGNNYHAAVDKFLKGYWGLKDRIKAAGPPSATNSGPRWSDDGELMSGMKGQWNDAARGDVDSIHYGGSCHKCVDQKSFLLHGSSNVRIADLSVYNMPTPGNTMAAAYNIGHYVAKFVISGKPVTLTSKEAFRGLYEYRSGDLTNQKFHDDINNHGYKSLYSMDGSNLLSGWLYDMIQDHEYYHNNVENGVCGITVDNKVNQFLISEGSYTNFALKFFVKIAPGLNSGMQVRSYVPSQAQGAQVFGPQLEIDDDDVGLFYHEGHNNIVSQGDSGMKSVWNVGGWNTYEAVIYDNSYYWRVNGKDKTVTFDQPDRQGFQIRDRLGLQIHWPMEGQQVGGEACWKHILVKELRSSQEAEQERARIAATTVTPVAQPGQPTTTCGDDDSCLQDVWGEDYTCSGVSQYCSDPQYSAVLRGCCEKSCGECRQSAPLPTPPPTPPPTPRPMPRVCSDTDACLQASASGAVDVSVEIKNDVAWISLTGPSHTYLSVAFGVNGMVTTPAPHALVVDGFGELTEWMLGSHAKGTQLTTNEFTIVEDVVEGSTRTVTLTRPVTGAHFTFPTGPTEIDWIDAVGYDKPYAAHSSRTSGKLVFSGTGPMPTSSPTPQPTPQPTPTPQQCTDICKDAIGNETPWGWTCIDLKNQGYCSMSQVRQECPQSCDSCDEDTCQDAQGTNTPWGYSCAWLGANGYCVVADVQRTCPDSCGQCR